MFTGHDRVVEFRRQQGHTSDGSDKLQTLYQAFTDGHGIETW
jgi:hypothetical protein